MTLFKSALVSLALAASALTAAPALATPVVITFDAGDPIGGLAAGAVLSNQYAAVGVTFAPNTYAGSGGPFGDWATNTSMEIASVDGDVDTLYGPALVSGNLLHSYSGWASEDGDPSMTAFFGGGITSFSADFAGVNKGNDVQLLAYLGTTLVASAVGTNGNSDGDTGSQFTLSLAGAGLFDRVVILPGSYTDWVGIDNITFNTAAVPEPATAALLALGLAGLAFARRRAGAN